MHTEYEYVHVCLCITKGEVYRWKGFSDSQRWYGHFTYVLFVSEVGSKRNGKILCWMFAARSISELQEVRGILTILSTFSGQNCV